MCRLALPDVRTGLGVQGAFVDIARPQTSRKRSLGGESGTGPSGTRAAPAPSCACHTGGGGYGRPVDRGVWTAKTVKRPRQQPAHPQYANYWAPLTRKRHTMPHSAQSQHTNYWAPRTRKRHQQEHRPQWPTESSDPTQHAKGRTGDRPGPREGATTRRNVTQGGGGCWCCVVAGARWRPRPRTLHVKGLCAGGYARGKDTGMCTHGKPGFRSLRNKLQLVGG